MIDATIISDIHLGGGLTRTSDLLYFLYSLKPTKHFIINGDLMDATAGVEFTPQEQQVLDLIQDIAKTTPTTWIRGNHDPHPELWAHLLQVEVADSIQINNFYITHGHQWDKALEDFPIITKSTIYLTRQLAKILPGVARYIKKIEKGRRGLGPAVESGAKFLQVEKGYTAVICGHTHSPLVAPGYVNEGSWCESEKPTYCEITGDVAELKCL